MKIALSIVIIRNKPENIKIRDYVHLLQTTFCKCFKRNSEQIVELKALLLETRKQLFIAENRQVFKAQESDEKKNSIESLIDKFKKLQTEQNKFLRLDYLNAELTSNANFMSNLIKLKSIEKNFTLNKTTTELIIDCSSLFLNQIQFFFFKSKLVSCGTTPNELDLSPIPIDGLLHSLQVFLNVYSIEWVYFARSSLIGIIEQLIDSLTQFILKHSISEKVLIYYCL